MEKRRRERVNAQLTITVTTALGQELFTETRDISMNGLFITTPRPYAVGTSGSLEMLLLCGDERLSVSAGFIVRRSLSAADNEYAGMGLEFTLIDSDSSIHLYNIIRYQREM